MLAASDLAWLRAILVVLLAVVAVPIAGWISRAVGWRPGGPLALIALTPIVPSLSVGLGISTDDVFPLMGLLLGLTVVDRGLLANAGWSRTVTIGAGLMAVAGLVAAVANASGLVDLLQLILKGTGHVVFVAAIATVVAISRPAGTRRRFLAFAIAATATFEAIFGIAAFVFPLPGTPGLEPTRLFTSLVGQVPGRVAGTTGLSPNFLGALFVLSIPITAALAMRTTAVAIADGDIQVPMDYHTQSSRAPAFWKLVNATSNARARIGWWVAVAAQLVALALTFTRTSLVIGVAVLIIQLLMRGYGRILLGLGALVVVVALVTPLGGRLLGDSNDRAALWTSAVRMTIDHPLTGVGPGRMLIVAASDPDRYQVTTFGEATNNAHNTILLAGAETGILGAFGALLLNLGLAAGALAGVVGSRTRERINSIVQRYGLDLQAAAGLGLLGFLVQGMTNNLFAVQVTSVTAALVVGGFIVPIGSLADAIEGVRAPLRRRTATDGSPSGP